MKDYAELIKGYKLVIWNGESDIKCPTGIFTADQIKQHWRIGNGVKVFYVVKGRNRSVATFYGTDIGSSFDTEDILECGKLQIKDFVEQDYRASLGEGEVFAECPMELIEQNLLIIDERED